MLLAASRSDELTHHSKSIRVEPSYRRGVCANDIESVVAARNYFQVCWHSGGAKPLSVCDIFVVE